MLIGIPGIQLKVLHLIRDVRSWTVSRQDNSKRKADFYLGDLVRGYGWKAGGQYAKRRPVYRFRQWYLGNRRVQDLLEREKIPSFQLGYEELCLHPNLLVRNICEFLDVKPVDSMLSLPDSGSHVALGNRMRSQKEKRQRIFYDNRWFYRNDWLLPAVLLPRIMRYNTAEVYRNIRGVLWSR